MNWHQLLIAALCLWAAIITVAYFRELLRHKRLRLELDYLLAEFTAMSKWDDVEIPLVGTIAMQQAAFKLEAVLNKEK